MSRHVIVSPSAGRRWRREPLPQARRSRRFPFRAEGRALSVRNPSTEKAGPLSVIPRHEPRSGRLRSKPAPARGRQIQVLPPPEAIALPPPSARPPTAPSPQPLSPATVDGGRNRSSDAAASEAEAEAEAGASVTAGLTTQSWDPWMLVVAAGVAAAAAAASCIALRYARLAGLLQTKVAERERKQGWGWGG